MPINVRKSGAWRTTDRVYVKRSGNWTRVYGAYVWSTKLGQTKWWPMFDWGHPANLPPPVNLRGIGASHSVANIAWDASSNPTVAGYRLLLHGIMWYPPIGAAPFPPSQTSFDWGGLGQDQTYTWTIVSENEAGIQGPHSNQIHLNTGHPVVNRYNPSWPAADIVYIGPSGTNTYMDGVARWGGDHSVRQGRPTNALAIDTYRGCAAYSNAYQQLCNAFGLNIPRSVLAVDQAVMMRVYRYKINLASNTTKVWVAPASINFVDKPIRHPSIHPGETWFNSPQPNSAREVFNFADPDHLRQMMLTWLGLTGNSYNGLMILETNGTQNQDGWGYVNMAGAGVTAWTDWVVRLLVRFAYEEIPYSAPAWW